MTKTKLKKILRLHRLWLDNDPNGVKADLSKANLSRSDLSFANLIEANLSFANLSSADLFRADLSRVNLSSANLSEANLISANLSEADLSNTNLIEANLTSANLSEANLSEANLSSANLSNTNLIEANLSRANLYEVKGLSNPIGIEIGNIYWKHFDKGLRNKNFQFKLGLNVLPKDQEFNDDERELCGPPGFYFATKPWVIKNNFNRHLIAKIRIPEGAKICEPWASNGKTRANKIEILKIYDTKTGKNITYRFRK